MSGYACDMGAWSQFFQDARSRVKDLTPAHVAIGEYLLPHTRDNFATQGGRERWQDLKPSTLTPERLRYGRRPLMKTLELFRGMTYVAQALYCDIGSRAKQARAQFFGTSRIPARSPFNYVAGVLEPIGDIYARFILGLGVH